jgi:hypothetical protein
MSWKNTVTYKDGSKQEFKHSTSEGDAKGWNESLAKHSCLGEVASVHLEHVADGPYDWSGKVTPIQTTYNK